MKKLFLSVFIFAGCNTTDSDQGSIQIYPFNPDNSCIWTSYLSETLVVDSLYTNGKKFELETYSRYGKLPDYSMNFKNCSEI